MEFRGVRTQYTKDERVKASFRYTVGVYQSRPDDWIGLFPNDAMALDQAVARVTVPDPDSHRMCDGGLWKSGDVTFSPESLSGVVGGGAYRLWYVRGVGGEGGRREVVSSQSTPFVILTDDSEFSSIQLQSMDDHILVNTLRAHSPTSFGSSFVIVSDDESSARASRKPSDHTPRQSHDIHTQEKALEGQKSSLETEILPGVGRSVDLGTDDEDTGSQDTTPSGSPVGEVVPLGLEMEEGGVTRSDPILSNKLEVPCAYDGELSDESPSPGDGYLRQLSLSESAVMVAVGTEEEVKFLKTSNRDLQRKVRKLTEKLEVKERESGTNTKELEETVGHLRDQIVELEVGKTDLDSQLHQLMSDKEHLLAENSLLQVKVRELEEKCAQLNMRGDQALQELSVCETQLQVERSERNVLEEKLDWTDKELERLKVKMAKDKGREVPSESREQPKMRPSELPLALNHERATVPGARHKSQHSSHATEKERHHRRHMHASRKGPEVAGLEHDRQRGSADRRHDPRVQRRREEGGGEGRREMSERVSGQRRETKMEAGVQRREGHREKPGEELSESRIAAKLRGNATLFVCPVCGKQLPARQTEYSATLHVEQCLATQAMQT